MGGLKHVQGKVIISCDLEGKNSWRFADGTTIRYERQVDNFNRRQTEPVNAICISGEGIPSGVQLLTHPNAICDTNLILNYTQISGKEAASSIKYYSISEDQCFIWRDENNVWHPLEPFATALRVFKPYRGMLEGIEPTLLKDTLFVTSGELKDKVVKTVVAADYCIVFQNPDTGQEDNLIRFRPFGDPKTGKEEEAVAILNKETEEVLNGELWVGIDIKDAKPFEISAYAD